MKQIVLVLIEEAIDAQYLMKGFVSDELSPSSDMHCRACGDERLKVLFVVQNNHPTTVLSPHQTALSFTSHPKSKCIVADIVFQCGLWLVYQQRQFSFSGKKNTYTVCSVECRKLCVLQRL